MESSKETLASRSTKLTQFVLQKGNQDVKYRHLISREGLLDALFALYDECSHEFMKRNKNIAKFVDKYHEAISEVRRLQVNASDFEIKRIIGRGHFGEVHMVREKQSGNTYAMKILKKSLTLEQEAVAFYEEERDIMMKANSPWITQLQYSFQDSRHLYLVMEFHPGGDMLSLLERHDNTLPEDVAQFYIAELVLAVHSVHSMGYVHRDIKPDNILIDRTGHLKLADFGSASKLNESKLVTSKMPVGTPDYISPEVLTAMNSNRPSSYGLGCDWWSVGVVAYEMLYGATPFGDDKVLVTYSNIMNFKKSLKFPDDHISDSAKNLLLGLLQDAKQRLGYKELYDHIFFKDVDWSNLLILTPPYVPTVTGEDDTSYFDEFDPESQRASLDPFQPKKEFNGKQLPFVGFTYSSCLSLQPALVKSSSIPIESITSTKSSDPNLEIGLKKEIISLEANNSSLSNEISILKSKLQRFSDEKKEMEEEIQKLKETLTEKDEEIASNKKLVRLEIENRRNTEDRAVELVKAIDKKYKKREALISEGYELNLALSPATKVFPSDSSKIKSPSKQVRFENDVDEEIAGIEEELVETREELKTAQAEIIRYKTLIESEHKDEVDHVVVNGHNQDAKSLEDEIENLKMSHDQEKTQLWEQLNNAQLNIEQLKGDIEMIRVDFQEAKMVNESLETEKKDFLVHIDTLKNIISQLEGDVKKVEGKLRRSSGLCDSQEIRDSNRELSNKVDELEVEIEEEKEKSKSLQETVLKIRSELANSQAELVQIREKYRSIKKDAYVTLQTLEIDLKKSKITKAGLETKISSLEKKLSSEKKEIEKVLNEKFEIKSRIIQDELKLMSNQKHEAVAKLEDFESSLHKVPDVTASGVQVELNQSMGQSSKAVISKVSNMEALLNTIHETQVSESSQVKELKEILRKKDREISDVKLDLRIALREKKESEDLLVSVREMNRNTRERFGLLEKDHLNCAEQEKVLTEKVESLELQVQNKIEEIQQISNRFESEKQLLQDRVQGLKEEQNNKKQLEEKCAKNEGQYEELDRQNSLLKNQLEKCQDDKQKLFAECDSLKLELKDKTQKCEYLDKNLAQLKTVCCMLEEDIKTTEDLLEKSEESMQSLKKDKSSLKTELEHLEHENKTVVDNLKADTKLRLELEAQMIESEDAISAKFDHFELTILNHLSTIDRQAETISQLTGRFTTQEHHIALKNSAIRDLKNHLRDLEDEIVSIKEETAKHITENSQLKKKSIDLQNGLENMIENCRMLQMYKEDLINEREGDKASFNQELEKKDAQLQQHYKLVEFLQDKQAGGKKKKWPFGFGSKDKNKSFKVPATQPGKENKRDRYFRMSVEMKEAQTKLNLKPGDSPKSVRSSDASSMAGSSSSDDYGDTPLSSSSFRGIMKHNIPHVLHEARCTGNVLCKGCETSIRFSNVCLKCNACNLILHKGCKGYAKNDCGLPKGLADSLRWKEQIRETIFNSYTVNDRMEGWVKTARKSYAGWEDRFMRLEGSVLCILEREPPTDATSIIKLAAQSVELCPIDGFVTLKESVAEGDINGPCSSSISNFANMMLLTIWSNSVTQHEKNFLVLLASFEEKLHWTAAIETIVKKHLEKQNKIISLKTMDQSLLLSLEPKTIEPTCCCHLAKEILLVGTTDGIYIPSSDSLPSSSTLKCRIPKISGMIHYILCIDKLALVVIVVGDERILLALNYGEILLWLKNPDSNSKISINPIANIKGCQKIVASQKQNVNPPIISLATADTFYLLKWNSASCCFVRKQEMKLIIPCSHIHMSDHVVLFATDKLYVVDLKEPGACVEEFLDRSNNDVLETFINKILKQQQSCVSIVTVSPPGKQEEYLFCLKDFGVVINYLGQQDNLSQLNWTKHPSQFYYQEPYLYVLYRNLIEVIHITPSETNLRGSWAYLNIPQPRLLGESSPSGDVYITSTSSKGIDILKISGSEVIRESLESNKAEAMGQQLPSIMVKRNSHGSENSLFSFTSSLNDDLSEPSDMLSAVLERSMERSNPTD